MDFLAAPAYILPFLVVLTVIVFVHEMGHYLVARWNGIAIQAFSIGFGPELVGFTDRRGTRWKLSAIPLGGYVRFVGDMNAASMPDEAQIRDASPELRNTLFVNKNVWQRIAVVVAGPAANVLFTLLVLYALLLGYGRYTIPPIIDDVTVGGPAQVAGMRAGDEVLSVDGYAVRGFSDFQRLVATAPGREVTIVVDQDGTQRTLTLVPEPTEITDRFGNSQRIGRVGVINNVEAEDYVLYRPNPVEAIGMTLEEVRFIIDRTIGYLGELFAGRGDIDQLGGPIKVAEMSNQVASLGIVALVNLMALLSLNIGIFNLLPIPLLDGGHLGYYLAEAIRGRPLSQRVQEIGYRFGMAVVLTLMVFTVINDIF